MRFGAAMNKTFAGELLLRMRPGLQCWCAAQSVVPLQIELRLNRLRLMEVIRAEAARKAQRRAVQPVASYAMT
jgi:hypothetical protein